MFRLIKNELKKLSKKKSVYITTIIVIAIIALINVIIYMGDDSIVLDELMYTKRNVENLTETLQGLDPENPDDLENFIDSKKELEFIELYLQYDYGSWQREVIEEEARSVINPTIEYKYRMKNLDALASAEAELAEFRSKLENDDWLSFVKEKETLYEAEITDIENALATETNKNEITALNRQLEEKKIDIEILNYRLDNDIPYGNNYLNEAINRYKEAKIELLDYDEDNLSKEEKKEYKQLLQQEQLNKYVLDNKFDLATTKNAHNILSSVIEDNMICIIIFVVMIAAGIVAEEFNKGTIKMLLVRPYKRWQILVSKYISCLIMLVFCVLTIILAQFLIGGAFFGFESYKVPAVIYNFSTNSVVEVSMLKHLFTVLASLLPIILLLMTLAFFVSTVLTSTSIAITVSFLVYFLASIINELIIDRNIKIMRFFPTMCWDLSQFLYGGKPTFEYATFSLCLTMDIIYLVVLLAIAIYVFNKKNVKNI